jgi:hypothetical protein
MPVVTRRVRGSMRFGWNGSVSSFDRRKLQLIDVSPRLCLFCKR